MRKGKRGHHRILAVASSIFTQHLPKQASGCCFWPLRDVALFFFLFLSLFFLSLLQEQWAATASLQPVPSSRVCCSCMCMRGLRLGIQASAGIPFLVDSVVFTLRPLSVPTQRLSHYLLLLLVLVCFVCLVLLFTFFFFEFEFWCSWGQDAEEDRLYNRRPPRPYAKLPYRELAKARQHGSTMELFQAKLQAARSLCLTPCPGRREVPVDPQVRQT